jgi:hypothetical protein
MKDVSAGALVGAVTTGWPVGTMPNNWGSAIDRIHKDIHMKDVCVLLSSLLNTWNALLREPSARLTVTKYHGGVLPTVVG